VKDSFDKWPQDGLSQERELEEKEEQDILLYRAGFVGSIILWVTSTDLFRWVSNLRKLFKGGNNADDGE
jgi:hypothetical protein